MIIQLTSPLFFHAKFAFHPGLMTTAIHQMTVNSLLISGPENGGYLL